MKFTHDELLNAVRIAGESGETFTCGAVRDCLGVKSPDRETLNLFHRRFRTFQKEAADEIERVGKNAYRLKMGKRARARREAAAGSVIAAVKRAEGLSTSVELASETLAAQPEVIAPALEVTETAEIAAAELETEAVTELVQDAAASTEAASAEAEAEAAPEEAPSVTKNEAPPETLLVAAAPVNAPLHIIQVEDPELPALEEPTAETLESLAENAPVTRTWRERWFGKRFAEFFGRA